MTAENLTAQEMKAHLERMGVETEIDFAAERLYVTAVQPYPTRKTLVSYVYDTNESNQTGSLDLIFGARSGDVSNQS